MDCHPPVKPPMVVAIHNTIVIHSDPQNVVLLQLRRQFFLFLLNIFQQKQQNTLPSFYIIGFLISSPEQFVGRIIGGGFGVYPHPMFQIQTAISTCSIDHLFIFLQMMVNLLLCKNNLQQTIVDKFYMQTNVNRFKSIDRPLYKIPQVIVDYDKAGNPILDNLQETFSFRNRRFVLTAPLL